MAILEKNLGSGSIATTDKTEILDVSVGRYVYVFSLVLTNTTGNVITVSIFVSDGTDRLFETVKIPAGSGKAISVSNMQGLTLEATHSISLRSASADAFNYKLSGSERT